MKGGREWRGEGVDGGMEGEGEGGGGGGGGGSREAFKNTAHSRSNGH